MKTLTRLVFAMVLLAMVCTLALAAPVETGLSISYELKRDTNVSVAIYAPQGGIVRELLHAAPRQQGKHTERWDGLDEAGKPVPPGTYTWKLLATDGLKAQYLMTIGTNPKLPWETWPGNHGGVYGIATDASGMYIATGCGEATAQCLKQDFAGERVWTLQHWVEAWCGFSSMAVDQGRLYTLMINEKLFVMDAATGKRLMDPIDIGFEDDRKRCASTFNATYNVSDLDAGHGQVVVSYTLQNLVRWLDPQTGKVIDEAKVEEPYGIAVESADSVLVISRDRVVRISRADKTPRTVINSDQLTGPYRLAVDPTNKNILVSENPARRGAIDAMNFDRKPPALVPGTGHQVKRFTENGKLVARIGRPGGRIDGKYDVNAFCDMQDLAAMPDGGFLISDGDPMRRTARFDKNGKWMKDWYGGWNYALYAIVDPEDFTSVWYEARGAFIKTRVDYAKKTFTIEAVYSAGEISAWFGQWGGNWAIRRHNGQLYICRTGGPHKGPAIWRLDTKANRLVMAVVGNSIIGHDRDLELGRTAHPLLGELYAARKDAARCMWSDRSGDGVPQADEFSFRGDYTRGVGWYLDDDLNYYYHHQTDNLDLICIYKLPVREWTKEGTPIYNWDDAQVIVEEKGWACDVWRAADGSIYKAYNQEGIENHTFGIGWWSPRCGVNRVTKISANGKIEWAVGRHAAGSKAQPGECKYLWALVGDARGCIAAMDAEDSMTHVWDKDGLWVGRLFDHTVIGPDSPREAYELCYENFAGALRENPQTGEVLYYGGGNNNINVFRITGWDGWQREGGTIDVTPEIAAALQARVATEDKRPDLARIGYMQPQNFKIDGKLDEWLAGKVTPLEIKDGATVLARVYLGWNQSGLLAAFDVNTAAPWKSSSTPNLAFQGGASVLVDIGPLTPERKTPMAGDVRVVVAPVGAEGKTTPVEFLPELLPGMGDDPNRKATYKTGNGEVTFARVAQLPGDWAICTPKADAAAPGYIVECRIPVREPLLLGPGRRFRIDLATLISDPAGTRSVLRLPWHSRDPGDMSTADTYFESLLRPQNWGEAVCE